MGFEDCQQRPVVEEEYDDAENAAVTDTHRPWTMAQIFGAEPFEENQLPSGQAAAEVEDELRSFYAMQQKQDLERRASRRRSTSHHGLFSKRASKRASTLPSSSSTDDTKDDVRSRKSASNARPQPGPAVGLREMQSLENFKPPPPLPDSIIPDQLTDAPAWFLKEHNQLNKYNIHNPVGPRFYRNVHLDAPCPAPSFFSTSFPPMATSSMQERSEDSARLPSAGDPSRSASNSPLPTPSSSQVRVGDVYGRSRKTSQTAHDNVDLLDGSDPYGQNWHHQSPYDVGLQNNGEPRENPNNSTSRISNITTMQSRHQTITPSPLSQSTSAIHLEPPLHEGARVTRKLSKRRTSVIGAMAQNLLRPESSSVPVSPNDDEPPAPLAADVISPTDRTTKRASSVPVDSGGKKESRGGVFARLAKRFSLLRKPAAPPPSFIRSSKRLSRSVDETRHSVLLPVAEYQSKERGPVKRVPPPSIDPPTPVARTRSKSRSPLDARFEVADDRASSISLERPFVVGNLTIANPDVPPETVIGRTPSKVDAPLAITADRRAKSCDESPPESAEPVMRAVDPVPACAEPVAPRLADAPKPAPTARLISSSVSVPTPVPLPSPVPPLIRASASAPMPVSVPAMAPSSPAPMQASTSVPASTSAPVSSPMFATTPTQMATTVSESGAKPPSSSRHRHHSSSPSKEGRSRRSYDQTTPSSGSLPQDHSYNQSTEVAKSSGALVPTIVSVNGSTEKSRGKSSRLLHHHERTPPSSTVVAPVVKTKVHTMSSSAHASSPTYRPAYKSSSSSESRSSHKDVSITRTETFKLVKSLPGSAHGNGETIVADGTQWEVVDVKKESMAKHTIASRSKDEKRRHRRKSDAITESKISSKSRRKSVDIPWSSRPNVPQPSITRASSLDLDSTAPPTTQPPTHSHHESLSGQQNERREQEPASEDRRPRHLSSQVRSSKQYVTLAPVQHPLQRNTSKSVRPTSELYPHDDLTAVRAKEAWEMERLWKAQSMYDGPDVHSMSLFAQVTATDSAQAPPETAPASAVVTNAVVHGSSHTSFIVQNSFAQASASSNDSTVAVLEAPVIASPRPPNPLPAPPQESDYQPAHIPLVDGHDKRATESWNKFAGLTNTAH